MIRTVGTFGWLACVACMACTACGGSVRSETGSAGVVANTRDEGAQPAPREAPEPSSRADASTATPKTCPVPQAGRGTFAVSATGLTQWEGKTVHVAAVVPGELPDGPLHRMLEVTSIVKNGAFRVECLGSIPEANNYPSWSVLLDVDADGRCSPQDVGVLTQNYGWGNEAGGELANYEFASIGGLHAPIGAGEGGTFCSAFSLGNR